MDMVNDGKDIRLDTPQAVKEALASGKDLYNTETGEFWWLYNATDSIATATIHLDDPNLLAVIDNPDFDLYEDIVGGLNYTGYITDSIETIIEDGEENAPLIDPRDEVFAQIASEDGWVIASPENVRKAVQSHMAENGADAPGKKNGMDKTAEIAAWKEKHVPIDRNGDDALVMHKMADGSREFIVAHGYDEETGHWGHGTYYDSLASAAADLEGRAISTPGMEVICPDFWYRDDIESALEEAGLEVNDANVDAVLEALDLDGEPILSNFHERLAETGNEMIADAVDNIEPNGGDGDSPEAFVDRGISLKAEAESMRRASQALSADGLVDEREPSFTPDFASVDEFMSSRFPNSATDWLDVSGNTGLEDMLQLLDIKQTDNVREWYMLAFPDDELVTGINPRLTFVDAIAAVPTGDGFYTALGETADSLLRERIFEELCNRYGYTYDEVYDSWLNESPLPSPAISQQPEKIAVAAGYRFNLVDAREASGIDLKGCGTVVTVDGHDYDVMKGATYEDSRKVDDLLDSHGDRPISDYRKRPQGMSLKQAVRESREASAKLAENNSGTDAPDGKDER